MYVVVCLAMTSFNMQYIFAPGKDFGSHYVHSYHLTESDQSWHNNPSREGRILRDQLLPLTRGLASVVQFSSCVNMQCMQRAILFYHFCPSVRLSNTGTVS